MSDTSPLSIPKAGPATFPAAVGSAAAAFGALALCGWVFDVPALKAVVPGLDAMNPLMAVGLAVAGASLLLRLWGTRRPVGRRAAQALAGLVVLLGATRLLGFITPFDLGLDRLMFVVDDADGPRAAGMAPNGAFILSLLGAALLKTDAPARRRIRPAQALALGALGMSLLPLIAYLYGFAVHHELSTLLPMPLHGAALMVLLSIAVLRLQPDGGVAACITGKSAAGAMARRLLPAALLVPVLIAALRVAGEHKGFYGTELGVGMMVVLNVGVLVALIWGSAWSLYHAEGEVRRLVAIVESSNDAIMGKTLNGTIVSWNAGAERTFGYTAAEVKGRRMSDVLVPPDRADEEEWILERLTRGERVDQLETVRLRKDGRPVEVSVTICPIRDAAGAVNGASVIARDISERKRLESAEQERSGLKQAVTAMEQVLIVVGHELRTPLAGIRITSELLLNDSVRQSEQCAPLLDSINREAVRMAGTVNNLLEAARLNSGLAQWNWAEFSPAGACEEAAATVRPLVDSARVSLALDAGPEDFRMSGDRDAFQRLVVNLAGNAHKFTEAGRIDVTVRQRVADDVRWTELTVRDTGCGIAPEIRGRLGEAFTLNAGIVGDHHVGGTGLGLAICRGIVRAHDGSMAIESEVGRGTCVTVRLRADLPGPMRDPDGQSLTRAA
jgi:PAS domain S-box-containing protein